MYVYIRVYYTDWILVKKQNQCCTEKLTLQNTLLSLLSLLLLVLSLLCIRTHPGGFLSSMHTLLTLHVPRWAQNESSKPAHLQDFVKVHTRTGAVRSHHAHNGPCLDVFCVESIPTRLGVLPFHFSTQRYATKQFLQFLKLLIRIFTEVAFNSPLSSSSSWP